MKKNRYIILITLFLVFAFQLSACLPSGMAYGAQAYSSKELIENANSLDGKVVIYKGEVVTAIMNRGEYSWVNLNDGDNAIGVWCKSDEISVVKFIGGYKFKGDLVEVEGIFHRACSEHGGDLDIHSYMIKIVQQGHKVKENLDVKKLRASIIIFLVILLAVVIFRRRL